MKVAVTVIFVLGLLFLPCMKSCDYPETEEKTLMKIIFCIKDFGWEHHCLSKCFLQALDWLDERDMPSTKVARAVARGIPSEYATYKKLYESWNQCLCDHGKDINLEDVGKQCSSYKSLSYCIKKGALENCPVLVTTKI